MNTEVQYLHVCTMHTNILHIHPYVYTLNDLTYGGMSTQMINRAIIIAILFCFFVAIVSIVKSRTTESESQLVVEPKIHSFGDVPSGTKLKKTFRLLNKSRSTIVFSQILTECSCTVPMMRKMRLYPAESTMLDVVWDTESSQGAVSTKIEIVYKTTSSNNHENLMLSARIIPDN